jgi:hypothetical protein
MPVQQRAQIKHFKKATLYVCVFDSVIVKMCVLALFALLLLQPIAPAFAFSEDGTAPEAEEIVVSDVVTVVEESPIVVPQEEEVESVSVSGVDEMTNEAQMVPESSVTEVLQDTEEQTLTEQETAEAETVPLEVQEDEVTLPETTNDTPQGETASSSEETVQDEEVVEEEVVDDVTETIPTVSTSTATTTVLQTEGTVHNASTFSFDTTQCAVVGDGAYYCSEKKAAVETVEDGVFSLQDSDGDLEIFMRVAGEQVQITHNTFDDAAPQYDALSKRVVWHGLVNDRYQIFSYDIEAKEISRFTSASYNNMEPMAYGSVTLWQAWIDSNWEIMLYDGNEQRQITNNTQNDVSPHMREGYIVWQTQFEDAWQVAVYDQETKEVEYIASEGGLKVENPRFVLVYDSTDKNGDSRTVGYDFDSKSSFDLGVLPQELPEELPEPDQTGETRALIQNKQTSREGEQEVIDVEPQTTSSGTTTEQSPHTLDLSAGPAVSSSTPQLQTVEDVVIPSFSSTSAPSQVIFESNDLVIPPFTATTTQ